MVTHPLYKIEWRSYRRSFLQPLRTAHGIWRKRQGLIVRLTDADGRVGYGECAPLSDFGTESIESALAWLGVQQGTFREALQDELKAMPALSYALGMACKCIQSRTESPLPFRVSPKNSWPVCALIPAGESALECLEGPLLAGYRTFKWKIGVGKLAQELASARQLIAALPAATQLRLDANGGLTLEEAKSWCACLADNALGRSLILEQPLAPGCESGMSRLQADYGIPIALDESLVMADDDRCKNVQGLLNTWQGFWVLKPSLIGCFPGSFLNALGLLARHPIAAQMALETRQRIILSSAFETDVGIDSLLSIAVELGSALPALGLDTVGAFGDGLNTDSATSFIEFQPDRRIERARGVWEALA